MLRLIMVRHGETAWNVTRRHQGQADIPLSDVGRQQAKQLAQRPLFAQVDAVYASDLKRAWETAEIVAAVHDLEVQKEPRLRELHFGDWQGLTYEEIRLRDPEGLAAWNDDRVNYAPPAGESLAAMARRLEAMLAEIQGRHSEDTVALFSHGGSLRVLLCTLLDYPLKAYWRFDVANTAVGMVELQSRGAIVTCWNDIHHLKDSI